jgi:hypothetical protein
MFSNLTYYDPRHVLVELRRQSRQIARRTDVRDAIEQMRTPNLKWLRELRDACVFGYGWSQVDRRPLRVAHAEAQDYDAVVQWEDGDDISFAPLQIKEVVPEPLNPNASLQAIVDSLKKYTDSADLTVAIRLNRDIPFKPNDLVIPTLKIGALWVFGALDREQTRWAIWGNFFHSWQCREFSYPTK